MRVRPALALVCLAVTCGVACTPTRTAPREPAQPLAAVSPLPRPTLPAWIQAILPVGDTEESAQVRVRFASDIVPLEALASPDRAEILRSFALEPNVPGRF